MKLHIPTGLLTLVIGAMSFAAAQTDYRYESDTKLGDLSDVGEIEVLGCNVELNSVNGGNGVTLYAYSRSETYTAGGPAPEVTIEYPASFKVNSNLVLNYSIIRGLSSSNAATLTANEITTAGKVTFEYANLHALDGNITISGKRYDDGFIAKSSVTNTNLIADKGSVNITGYLTMGSGTISAADGVNITNSSVTINGLSAQSVNINADGELNIAEAGRVELGEIAVGAGASLGIDGAILVFNEESSITLAEGATLTAFNNVSMEFILDADSITGSGEVYTFEVFAGIDNLTDEGSLAIIEEFEQAVAAGVIGITFKTAEGEQIELDTGSTNVSFTNGTLSIRTDAVPEPTTATLSLLALAGLAARRRRK